jgi:hypothetical protein
MVLLTYDGRRRGRSIVGSSSNAFSDMSGDVVLISTSCCAGERQTGVMTTDKDLGVCRALNCSWDVLICQSPVSHNNLQSLFDLWATSMEGDGHDTDTRWSMRLLWVGGYQLAGMLLGPGTPRPNSIFPSVSSVALIRIINLDSQTHFHLLPEN